MAKQKHIVTAIRPFNFANDDGEKVQGVTVYYLDTTNENSEYGQGHAALNLTLIGEHSQKFTKLPGVYDLDFRQARDTKGRPVLKLQDVQYLKPFNLEIVI
ncbi:hypothetical protein FITA111629_15585 [Filibacter tadaridae]|uniref:Uncharacterized protein n=1 Tax=Filibacter tadaridae TaxID=2483811 RepID=A0A3P5WSM9_9BACL|nr:hypothetical protein [Filibacter tadaridae]VDC17969.1 hypothetical protein FILTAD_00003 [Filibacter tadaridae]